MSNKPVFDQKQQYLTKSHYKKFKKCPRLLWLSQKHPNAYDENNDPRVGQFLARQGRAVGEIIKHNLLYYSAKPIFDRDPTTAYQETLKSLKKNLTVLEGTFIYENLIARADVVGSSFFTEVKSSSNQKDDHLLDVSWQYYVLNKCIPTISQANLALVNKKFTLRRRQNLFSDFFNIQNVTTDIQFNLKFIKSDIKKMEEILSAPQMPQGCKLGPQCKDCPFTKTCFPDADSSTVLNLKRGGQKKYDLYNSGIKSLIETPEYVELTPFQILQKQAEQEQRPIIQTEKIQHFLKSIKYPLHFIDFECFLEAIPRYYGAGTYPFQNIPFQISIHQQQNKNAPLKHFMYLHKRDTDPRYLISNFINKTLKSTGSIISWHASYEKKVLEDLAHFFPEVRSSFQSIINRLFDLETVFDKGWYLDSRFNGSSSIKNILPVLLPHLSYESLNISNGSLAYIEYLRMIDPQTPDEEVNEIAQNLEKYCELDTYSLWEILNFLKNLSLGKNLMGVLSNEKE
jgi:CRISPR/Cas system-associated exonuclease Cas4 (RecB family)